MSQSEQDFIAVSCPHCHQPYEAPASMAGTQFNCQVCNVPFEIPRPLTGELSEVTEAQLEEAELHDIQVQPGMSREQLDILIEAARKDYSKPIPIERRMRYSERKAARRTRETHALITELKAQLQNPQITAKKRETIERKLQRAEDKARTIVKKAKEEQKEFQSWIKEAKQQEKEDAAEERALRRELFEGPFSRGEDWAEFYIKPSRSTFDDIYAWLDENRPGWSSISDVTYAIDQLYPELKKR